MKKPEVRSRKPVEIYFLTSGFRLYSVFSGRKTARFFYEKKREKLLTSDGKKSKFEDVQINLIRFLLPAN
ncbi:MAG TPA: hypothetical protein VGB00_08205, partial [Pyrinomonadaceae bacterium]